MRLSNVEGRATGAEGEAESCHICPNLLRWPKVETRSRQSETKERESSGRVRRLAKSARKVRALL